MLPLGDLAQWGATGIIFAVLLLSIRRNGKTQKARDLQLAREQASRETTTQERLKSIKEAITSPKYGLEALKEDICGMKTHCEGVTSGFAERIKIMEKGGK